GVAVLGIVITAPHPPNGSAWISVRKVVPWLESTKESLTFSSTAKLHPWTRMFTPGGPDFWDTLIVPAGCWVQSVPSQVQVSAQKSALPSEASPPKSTTSPRAAS